MSTCSSRIRSVSCLLVARALRRSYRARMVRRCVSLSCLILSCSAGTLAPSVDAGEAGSGSTHCKTSSPASQGPSQPCCAEWGADACGANLFCAAFDGRTQTTCYPDHVRLGGQTCTADSQCASVACAASGVCRATPGASCDPSLGCGTTPTGGGAFYCGRAPSGASTCLPCTAQSSDPACSSSPRDAGPDGSAVHCGQPGNRGNSLGVGKYCVTPSDCTGSQARVCSNFAYPETNYCTTICQGTDAGATCGELASCVCSKAGGGCACLPDYCK